MKKKTNMKNILQKAAVIAALSHFSQKIVSAWLLIAFMPILGSGPLPAAEATDPLRSGFLAPPDSAKPQTWWHWMNGNVTKEGITADLEAMKRVGVGGVQVFNVNNTTPQGPVDFMSPAWRELVRFAIAEASRLDLSFTMMICAGWSNSGGPWVKPEQAMQMLAWTDLRVDGPRHFSEALPQAQFAERIYSRGINPGYRIHTEPLKPVGSRFYRDIGVFAFPTPANEPGERTQRNSSLNEDLWLEDGGETNQTGSIQRSAVIDLTSRLQADGRLVWDVPAGHWTILRLGYTPTDQFNHPAPPGGAGLECDKFSRAAMQAVWDGMMKGVIDNAGPLVGRTLNGVLIDSWEVGSQHWSPVFAAEFTKRRGYDPAPWLPVLSGRIVGTRELSDRFLWDMRRTGSDLIADNYYAELTRLCHANGIQSVGETYGGPLDEVQAGGTVDIPMGEFWAGNPDEPVSPEMAGSSKLSASAAHGYGKPIVAAEAFTARPDDGKWSNDPYSLKVRGDWAFCQGINRYVFHRYAHQPWLDVKPGMTMGPYGIHFERSNTWWEQGREWLLYIARCQFMLQQGGFVADVAYFAGDQSPSNVLDDKGPGLNGYDYDFLSADLLQKMRMVDGRLTLPSGMSYKALVVGGNGRLRTTLVEKIRELALAGAPIACPRPEASPSLQDYPDGDARIATIAAELWDGKRVATCDATTLLRQAGILPDVEAPLEYIHRKTADADIYFLANPLRKTVDCRALFRLDGRQAEVWHPDTGAIEPATVIGTRTGGRTELALHFDPAGSLFVVFQGRSQKPEVTSQNTEKYWPEFQPMQTLAGPWQVEFPPKLGAPAAVTLDRLISLSEHSAAGVRYFSGTATYRKDFDLASGTEKNLLLDLGDVQNIAEVILNGVNLGILWKPPFAVDITAAAQRGMNRLEVRVTNQWINRLIGDEQEPPDVEWVPGEHGLTLKEWPEWFQKGMPRPSSGRIAFTTFKHYEKDSPLVKSGLLGPVQLLTRLPGAVK